MDDGSRRKLLLARTVKTHLRHKLRPVTLTFTLSPGDTCCDNESLMVGTVGDENTWSGNGVRTKNGSAACAGHTPFAAAPNFALSCDTLEARRVTGILLDADAEPASTSPHYDDSSTPTM